MRQNNRKLIESCMVSQAAAPKELPGSRLLTEPLRRKVELAQKPAPRKGSSPSCEHAADLSSAEVPQLHRQPGIVQCLAKIGGGWQTKDERAQQGSAHFKEAACRSFAACRRRFCVCWLCERSGRAGQAACTALRTASLPYARSASGALQRLPPTASTADSLRLR